MIPQRLRERQGLTPGAHVVFEEVSEGVLIKPEPADEQLRGRYRGSGLARRLLEDRAAEPGR